MIAATHHCRMSCSQPAYRMTSTIVAIVTTSPKSTSHLARHVENRKARRSAFQRERGGRS